MRHILLLMASLGLWSVRILAAINTFTTDAAA